MEKLALTLLQNGGTAGAVVFVLLIIIAVLAKAKGWSIINDKSDLMPAKALKSIDQKLGGIEKRLDRVEIDLEQRPSRQEFHEIDLSLARLNERFLSVEKSTVATQMAVQRMEHFIIQKSSDEKG